MLSHTMDLDICNAVFVISDQILLKLGIVDAELYETEIQVLRRVATSRSDVILGALQTDDDYGKRLLRETLCGRKPPPHMKHNVFLNDVIRVGRFLRWLACSCLPETYEQIATQTTKWAEASTFALWWQRAEDYILRAWEAAVLQFPVRHLSLHFDGLRVDRSYLQSRRTTIDVVRRD